MQTQGGDIISKVSTAPESFCINPDGSVVVPGADHQVAVSEPLVMIRSEMSGDRASLTVLRLDHVGFSELGSRQDTAAGIDALVGKLEQEGSAAFHARTGAGVTSHEGTINPSVHSPPPPPPE
jgi:hypothetical protein